MRPLHGLSREGFYAQSSHTDQDHAQPVPAARSPGRLSGLTFLDLGPKPREPDGTILGRVVWRTLPHAREPAMVEPTSARRRGGSRVAIQLDRTDSSGHGWPTCSLRIVRRPGSGLVQHGSLIGGQFRAGGRTRRVRQGSNPAGQTFRADGRYDRKRRGRPAGKRHGLLQMPVQPSFTARMA